jgi:hypothetical protein
MCHNILYRKLFQWVLIMKKLIFALMLTCGLSASAMAQVNTKEGACEDSSCSRRVLSIFGSMLSSTSSTSTTTDGGSGGSPSTTGVISTPVGPTCMKNKTYGPYQACPAGFTGTWRTVATTTCPYGDLGLADVSTTDTMATDCAVASAPPAPTPAAPASCIPGMGSTSNGEPGYCVDCDDVAWVDGPFATNNTAQQRACWSRYNTQTPPIGP